MGLFKDIKKVADHHGGMPSMRGAFNDIKSMVDDRGESEVLERGTPAKAIVKGFAEPVPGDRFAMHVPLEVHPQQGAPYQVDYVFPTTRMKAAITVGMEIPVKVHPDDPQRVAVQWEAQQGAIAAAGGDIAAVHAGMASTYAAAADKVYREARAKSAAEDPAEKIKKLGDMLATGLITQKEFDAKKAKILDEM